MARKLNPGKIKQNLAIGKAAIKQYKKGLTLREIARLEKKSHEFIRYQMLKIDPHIFN